MADTSIMEVARATHEEIERYEQAVVDLLLSGSSSSSAPMSLLAHKLALQREHKVSELLDRIVDRKAQLREFYQDPTHDREKELATLTQVPTDTKMDDVPADPFAEFHKRLAKIQDFHARYPQAAPEAFAVDFSTLEATGPLAGAAVQEGAGTTSDFVDRMFSGEEMLGKYLDLNLQHDLFSNLKGVRKVPYVVYLDHFDQLVGPEAKVPVQTKKADMYRQYLVSLRDYLGGFLRKTRPLSDVDAIEREVDAHFEQAWQGGTLNGWSKFGPVSAHAAGVEPTRSAPEESPSNQGIWCAACRRMYSKQTVYNAHLDSPKHQKAAARLAASEGNVAEPSNAPKINGSGAEAKWRHVAQLELYVLAYAKVLDGTRQETRSNIERRAALTEREREAEAEAAEAALHATGQEAEAEVRDEEEGEGEDKLYNPLRLPLGWDGKPIPYWLYKLHGLGVEYKCQICSDYVYQGRRAFEKHFQESRHAFGMRALGLPNTKHFFEITEIADALALAEKLKKQGRELAEEQHDAEEVEDEQGNAYSRKTYEMMRRQGLL